jgi:transcriptional regulator with XRE-family HTH domain
MPYETESWDADAIRALRERLGLTQRELADDLGVRQQTVSEWETGIYRPRGASARMLRLVAERAASYQADHPAPEPTPPETPVDTLPHSQPRRRTARRYKA